MRVWVCGFSTGKKIDGKKSSRKKNDITLNSLSNDITLKGYDDESQNLSKPWSGVRNIEQLYVYLRDKKNEIAYQLAMLSGLDNGLHAGSLHFFLRGFLEFLSVRV
jgi:hypothetical protein